MTDKLNKELCEALGLKDVDLRVNPWLIIETAKKRGVYFNVDTFPAIITIKRGSERPYGLFVRVSEKYENSEFTGYRQEFDTSLTLDSKEVIFMLAVREFTKYQENPYFQNRTVVDAKCPHCGSEKAILWEFTSSYFKRHSFHICNQCQTRFE